VSRAEGGFSALQLLVASGIASLLIVVVAALSLFSGRSFAALANYAELDARSRNALDRMTKEIRQAKRLRSYETNELVLVDGDDQELRYTFNPSERTLTWSKNGQSEVLLTECDFLQFSIFQRNPVNGQYDVYPTGTPATCKLIQLSWVCSRTILGAKVNTESVQSAKVVIRKQ
jgi:hypothetical protein